MIFYIYFLLSQYFNGTASMWEQDPPKNGGKANVWDPLMDLKFLISND